MTIREKTKSLRILLLFIKVLFVCSAAFSQGTSCQQILDKQLCTKIGQMLIVGFGGYKQDQDGRVLWSDPNSIRFNKSSLIAEHIAIDHIGGVILFSNPVRNIKTGEYIRERNIQNPEQVAQLNQELQNYNNQIRKAQGLDPLPLFISVDQEGGRVDRLSAIQRFPVRTLIAQAWGAKEEAAINSDEESNMITTSSLNTPIYENKKERALQETYLYARKLAQEVAAANFNVNFAPVVDVNINPTNPIIGGIGRSFSSSPVIVVDQAKQFIKAFDEYKIISVLKHFPGHGSSGGDRGDSHEGLVDVTNTYQKEKELFPYFSLIREDSVAMIMTTHVINGQLDKTQCKNGLKTDHATWCPGTMSKQTLTDLLRGEMKFNGLIVSDDMTMGAIAKEYSLRDALKSAINAGVDLFIISNNEADQTKEAINTIAQLVHTGEIKREQIEKIYDRITKLKQRYLIVQ